MARKGLKLIHIPEQLETVVSVLFLGNVHSSFTFITREF